MVTRSFSAFMPTSGAPAVWAGRFGPAPLFPISNNSSWTFPSINVIPTSCAAVFASPADDGLTTSIHTASHSFSERCPTSISGSLSIF
ncbi:hypothetical protein DI43_02795 [Geobacillus sp. CAMR12739]|nr:hypothetical protein DI43_02795 [Geobacillus sp. CAMR12739]